MSLITGFLNKKVDVYHKSLTKTASGGGTPKRDIAVKDMECRIDQRSGALERLTRGEEAKNYEVLYCEYRTDLRDGDIITNVRDQNGAVQYDYRNGVAHAVEYVVTNMRAPGSELDHLEIEIYKVSGQSLT